MSPAKVKLALFDYIEGFYNTHRIHTALKGESPREFARKALAIAAGGFISDEF
jgi:transposase InsO family protein